MSNWFISESKIGDVFELGQPYGDMQQNIKTPNLIMLAAGSGITPMLSLITAIKQSQQLDKVQVQLLYWVKQRSDAAFVEYFEKLHSNIRTLIIRFSIHKKPQMMSV